MLRDVKIPPSLHEAVRLDGQGAVAAAESMYRRLLAAEPANADASHRLGLLLLKIRGPRDAAEWIELASRFPTTLPS